MGNSESFDLMSISDLKNSTSTTKKKQPTHHQHSQSISPTMNSITSFDLNGIFRRLSDDNTDFRASASEKTNATNHDEVQSKSESPEPNTNLHDISLTSESDYVEKIETDVKCVDMAAAIKEFSMVSLTGGEVGISEEEGAVQVQLTNTLEIVKKIETVEVVIVNDENEDIIALDGKEQTMDNDCVLDNLESESESKMQETEIESVNLNNVTTSQAECENKCLI